MQTIKATLFAAMIASAVLAYAQTEHKSDSSAKDGTPMEDMGSPPDIMPGHEPKASVEPKTAPPHGTAPETISNVRELTAVNIEYQGSKIWIPSIFIVKRGERVRIKLINKTPSGVHGFAIDEFGVKVEVASDKEKVAEFTTDKAGLFRVYCHMHPAHIGGQIFVIE